MGIEEQIPGFAAALAWEAETRELAFLGIAAPIRDVPVQPLTLRRLGFLLQARSAFFYGQPVGAEDVVQFLWLVSPRFRPCDLDERARFIAEVCNGTALDDLDAASAEIRDFLDAAFNDAPAAQVTGAGGDDPIASFTSALVHGICRKYTGWTMGDVLDAPLSCIYQQLRRIGREADPKAVFISRRSRKVKGEWLRAMQATVEQQQPEN